MKNIIILSIFIPLLFTACSSKQEVPMSQEIIYQKPTPQKLERFQTIMHKVALSTKENESYNRMALDTPEKKSWFKNLMYRLWDRQITRHTFIVEGLNKYPMHRYEFIFVSNGFQRF
jgi:hypothetical protein